MLYLFGFDTVSVAVGDLYFVNPEPAKGQEGAEHGVRLELRWLRAGELKSSIYSARPITVDAPIWRVDLLESVDGRPGSFDRTHHHPRFDRWDPGERVFEKGLSADPVGWLGQRLTDIPALLAQTGLGPDAITDGDRAGLTDAVPEILDATRRLLARVRAGELGRKPAGAASDNVRASWL